MKNLRIIVIGASMGGIEYFTRLIPQLSADWPIAVFIVQHIASRPHWAIRPYLVEVYFTYREKG